MTSDVVEAVDFVVCTRNNRKIIGDTLRAILAQTVTPISLTVVDGRSTDGTPEFVRSEFPQAKVIIKDQDSGPAASRNIGIHSGRSAWIVLVDSDVQLAEDWTEEQLRFLRRGGNDLACGKLLYASDPNKINAVYGAMNRFGIAWDVGVGDPANTHADARKCLWACTSAIMIRRTAAEELGGFDEAMFAIHEDCDYGWRANILGYSLGFNPRARATHNVHGTLSGNSRMTYLLYRNRLRSALVNYEPRQLLRYVVPYIAMSCGDALVRAPRLAKAKALLWNLAALPDTMRRRSMVQRKRKLRDDQLWELFETGVRGPGYEGYS